MTLRGFLLACAAIVIPSALIVFLEWRSHPRDTPKAAGLRSANRRDKGGGR